MLWCARASLVLADIAVGTGFGGALNELAGRHVLVRTSDQLFAALALIELDGVAARMVLCPPDLDDGASGVDHRHRRGSTPSFPTWPIPSPA